MENFLEYSQRIKEEIKNSPTIIHNIKLCFLSELEPFQEGTEHEVYRLGKTESGAFLVLRKKKFDLNANIERFEIYCRNAEALSTSRLKGRKLWRPNSPSFCIGVIYQSKHFGVITEDMSEGGKYQMSNSMGSISSDRILNGEVVDEVDVDLDGCHAGYLSHEEIIRESSYFTSSYVLEIF
jgi:hypothetical protein